MVRVADGIFMRLAACEDVDSFYVYNNGDGVLEWTVTCDDGWVSFDPVSGTNIPGVENRTYVRTYFDRTGVADGEYRPRIRILSNGGDDFKDPYVTVHENPLLTISPPEITVSTDNTTASFSIGNSGRQPLDWSMSATEPWITIDPPLSGTQLCTEGRAVDFVVDIGALPSVTQRHDGEINVTSNGGDKSLDVIFVPSSQEGGFIGVFADAAGTDCNLVTTTGLLQVYILHMRHTGATAAQFAAPMPACLNAVWLGDTGLWPTVIGTSQDGVSVGYGACLGPPVYIMLINYLIQADIDPCCLYPVLPDPDISSGEILGVDCDNNVIVLRGGTAIANPDTSCLCSGGGDPRPVQATTGGRVKALYQ